MNKDEIKLKTAAEEIKEILRKHDIAAAVALHTPGHGEYFMHFNTSYSCAYMYNDEELRFYSKRADYSTPEEHVQKVTNTANMTRILADIIALLFMGLSQANDTIEKAVDAEHTTPIHTKHKS